MDQITYRIIIEPDGKLFHAFVPVLPGCHTFGRTIAEAQRHIQEALELYLESLLEHGTSVPRDHSFETFHTVSVPRQKVRGIKASARQYA